MPDLFSPYSLKSVELRNRIAVPPMCQYSAEDGLPNDWHQVHYASLSRGGAGLVIVEATGVAPEGRISPGCLGFWSDEHTPGHAAIVKRINEGGAVPGIQLAHAGRKASANKPWEGDDHIAEDDPRGWQPIGPSAVPFGANLPRTPTEMTKDDIERVKADFVAATKRSVEAGYKWLELHFAHGYLAQSFWSPVANKRDDEYGGSPENRARFLLETIDAVKAVWPEDLPLTVRLGVIEYDGNDDKLVPESIELIKKMKDHGVDFVSVSVGFNTPEANIPWGPAFLAPVSQQIREEADIPVATAWGVDDPVLANKTIKDGQLDLVMVGRAHLANPHWSYDVAKKLGKDSPSWVLPTQYAHWLARYAPADYK